MFLSSRSRLMLAALIFALGWASGAAVHRLGLFFLAAVCFAVGSAALSYLVWEYHRAWRLRPLGPDPKASLRLRNWPGISLNGLTVRPEYITVWRAPLFFCCGKVQIFSSHPAILCPTSAIAPRCNATRSQTVSVIAQVLLILCTT